MAKHYKEESKGVIVIRIGNLIYKITLLILIILAAKSSIEIVKWYSNNKDNEIIQQEIAQSITINENETNIQNKYVVDFATLKEKNSETVAWLKVNGTDIEYTVVQAINNSYYLTHNFNKEYNKAGWIFADYKNKLDGTDKNIVIYGHNIKDDSMFGSLRNVISEEWYNNPNNYKILFTTENEAAEYEVFSVYQIENEDYYIQTNFADEIEFTNFIKTIKSRSIKDFNIEITGEDKILTLSTCANNNKYRVVLHAKKIS